MLDAAKARGWVSVLPPGLARSSFLSLEVPCAQKQ